MNERRMNGNTLEILSEGNTVMSLSEEIIDSVMHIKVSGEIRNDVAHEFEDELMAALSVCRNIRLDLSETSYIASIAMRTLLSVQQLVDEKEGASLIITGLSELVKEIFDDAGFLDILTFSI